MGAKYTSQSTTGYNSSPPADDGSQTASNLITWAGIKGKLADVLKTFSEAINTQLVAVLNLSARAISSNDSAVAGDHWRSLEVTAGAVVTLPDAATVASGWVTTITNVGTSNSRITRATGANKINGVAGDLVLAQGASITVLVNAAQDGYITVSARDLDLQNVGGRLTLTTGVAVTTVDVTSATTLFFTPYKGNKIALFDGSATWSEFPFSEVSIAAPSTSSTPSDVFAYNSSGTVTLELTTWTNTSSRATALVLQNGVLVRSGGTTRRYLGTICTSAGFTGQLEDSASKRLVWNYYNRVLRPMKRVDGTDNWAYSNTSYQQANASALNQLEYVMGVSEDAVDAHVFGMFSNSTASSVQATIGVGLDSITVNSADRMQQDQGTNTTFGFPQAWYRGFPGVGRRRLVWLEYGAGSDAQTWRGDNATTLSQTGIQGTVWG